MGFIYKRINWGAGAEPVSNEKLNDMINNMDYLYENMITGYYNMFGLARNTGLSIRAGAAKTVFTEIDWQNVAHYFARPFLPGTRPIIVSGFNSDIYWRVWQSHRGLDGRSFPDHRGFIAGFNQLRYTGGPSEYGGEQWYSYVAIAPNG